MADTGHGTLLSISTITLMGCARSLDLPSWAQEAIDSSCLDTDEFRTFIPSDLLDPGQIVAEIVFDPKVALDPSTWKSIGDVVVTWPISDAANTTNATLTAKGFVLSFEFPTMVTDDLQIATLTIQLTGDSTAQPAFVEESA